MQFIYIILTLIFGSIFLYVGMKALNAQRRVRERGIRTKALIVDFYLEGEQFDPNNTWRYQTATHHHYPIVRFTDEDGVETTQQLNYTSHPDKYQQYINILYIKHGENDYEMIIDSNFWSNIFPQLFIGVGAVALLIGVLRLIGWLGS